MFPGTAIRSSSGDHVLSEVPSTPSLVAATVGAEPWTPEGYAAVVILDTWLTLERDDMRVTDEALRRWAGAAGLVRRGGHVVAVGEPGLPVLQALVRWDPAGLAEREMEVRASAHLPPAVRVATLIAEPGALDDALVLLDLPEEAEVLGPVPDGERHRVVIRVPRARGSQLADSLAEMQRLRSARKLDAVRVQVDPMSL